MKTTIRLWARLLAAHVRRWWGSGDGCCTCGERAADFYYWGACDSEALGLDPSRPDWAQCTDCHNATDAHGSWMRTLRWEVKA